MLTEQRYKLIVEMVDRKKSITVAEIRDELGISESTARRDITALDKAGKLTKVFGGAVANHYDMFTTREQTVEQKKEIHKEEKQKIARYAASLIEPDDFVYIDAGTTTSYMIDYVTQQNATYVTNAVEHARKLANKGMHVILVGGELKVSTEALIGATAAKMLLGFHFTKGFFGTNGITKKTGCTTPDIHEAAVKSTAMEQCKTCYVVADGSKFDRISSVTFSGFYDVEILTDRIVQGFEEQGNITVVP